MTDDYLRQAKDQLDRDLVPGHPLRRVVDELIEARKERDEARSIARQTLSAQLEGKVAVWNLSHYPWLKGTP